jgi:hypothetical protein
MGAIDFQKIQNQIKINVNFVGQECPTHTGSAQPKARDILPGFRPGLAARDFGGCTPVCLQSFLETAGTWSKDSSCQTGPEEPDSLFVARADTPLMSFKMAGRP